MTFSIENLIREKGVKRVLALGIGGGGDVVATLPTVNHLREIGADVIIGSVTWERYVVDPEPGPRSLDEVENIERITETTAYANSSTRTKKGLVFQASRLASILGERVILVDLNRGVRGVVKGLKKTLERLGIQLIVGIDGGGDVLAKGSEPGLRSPLSDTMMLSALVQINVPVVIGILGFGSDGELTQAEILEGLSEMAKAGGYLGARGITSIDVEAMERALTFVQTEASRIPVLAAKGLRGYLEIREGARRVDVSIISTITFYLDARTLYNLRPAAQRIRDTRSIWEANEILHEVGLKTELDFEIERHKVDD